MSTENPEEITQTASPIDEPIITEMVKILFEFEFDDFTQIFTTLQKMTDKEIEYKVLVAATRETGFPILELSGPRNAVEEMLAELGYTKDMMDFEDDIESEEDVTKDEDSIV